MGVIIMIFIRILSDSVIKLNNKANITLPIIFIGCISLLIKGQEILREELNRRFLAAQEPAGLPVLGSTPYVRADIHQHQHMHQHQHQHTHQHMFALPGLTGSLVPSPAPHLVRTVLVLSVMVISIVPL